MRHLHPTFAQGALRRGSAVTQLLPDSPPATGRPTITWLRASRRSEGKYIPTRHHVFDEGSPDFLDVWDFSPVEDGEPLGEGVDLAEFDSPDALLEAAERDHGANPDRWVNDGMVQDEYRDLRQQ